MYINNQGHMTKVAAVTIYGKNLLRNQWADFNDNWHETLYYVYIHVTHDPVIDYFTAMSTKVTHAFEWGNLLKSNLKGTSCRKWAVGLNDKNM